MSLGHSLGLSSPLRTMRIGIHSLVGAITLWVPLGAMAGGHCPAFLRSSGVVQQAVLREARGGWVMEYRKLRIEGRTIHVAEVERPSEIMIYVDDSGGLVRLREEIQRRDLPKPVVDALAGERGELDEVERESVGKRVTYLVEMDLPDGREVHLIFSPDGLLLRRFEKAPG